MEKNKKEEEKKEKIHMKYNKISMKLSMVAMAAAMAAAPAVNVFAAPEDIIDTTRKASLTVHKYDTTAAEEDDIDLSQFKATGIMDAAAEAALQRYVIEGVEFTYLKVGDINTETVAGKVQVMYDIPVGLQRILGLTTTRTDNKYTSDEINDALVRGLQDTTKLKNQLEDYINSTPGHVAMPMTDADGRTGATDLPLGLYLLVETKVPANVTTTVDPFFVSLPMTDLTGEEWMYDIDVYPKNQTNIPDLNKVVRQHDDAELYNRPDYADTATISEGERADYLLISHMPTISSKATHLTKYTFTDTMAKGLRYNRDAVIYFYDNEFDAEHNNVDNAVAKWTDDSNFFATYNTENGIDSIVRYEITNKGLDELNKNTDGRPVSEYSDRWMVISYSVTSVSSSDMALGDIGNTNDANLVWRRSNMEKEDKLKDRARVFSYGIDLKKLFKPGDNAEEGDATKVAFSLKNNTDGHYVTATKESDGVYHVTDATKGATEAAGTEFTPAADGTLIINGLEADEYILTELRTSAGYTLLKEPITINIKATEDTFTASKTTLYDKDDIANNPNKEVIEENGDRASATVDGNATNMKSVETTKAMQPVTSTNARVEMSVTNTPGFKLPATGGTGTIICTVAGCSVAFAGIAVATKKSKKHEEK